jgi:7-keto-8-aminopelargonate synthetase-like enzyme
MAKRCSISPSNDYLGLAGNADIAQALADGALQLGGR